MDQTENDATQNTLEETTCDCSDKNCEFRINKDLAKGMDEQTRMQKSLALKRGCYCDDPQIQAAFRLEMHRFLRKLFKSKKRMKRIFGRKYKCAQHITRIRLRITLL